jgi:hypothetical protein
MKLRKLLGLFVILALTLGLVAGCTEKDNGDNNIQSNTGGTEMPETGVLPDGSIRDLGGMVIDIGIFWAPTIVEGTTDSGRATLEWRDYIQTRHNFTIQEKQIGQHGDHADVVAASILAGNPIAYINRIDPGRIVSLVRNDMFYDVSTLPTVDLTLPKWNRHVHDAMSFDGGTFGFVDGYNPFNAGVLFFNKDVLREAGIDPMLPYDLQAANEWTWDEMMRIAETVTRDVDNDGINDYFGFCLFSNRTMLSAVYSNNSRFVGKDAEGRFTNDAYGSNAFLQAFDHVRNMDVRELMQPQPEGAGWEWWRDGFKEGRAAFIVWEEYAISELADTDFDWGMVLYPRGPAANKLITVYYENINTIPSILTAQQADDIMFAFDLFTEDHPDYADDDMAWKYGAYDNYRDPRAVDETLAMLRSGEHTELRLDSFVPSFSTGDVTYDVWNLEETGAQLLEAASQSWNSFIESANRSIFGS